MKKIINYIKNNSILFIIVGIIFAYVTALCYGKNIEFMYRNELNQTTYYFCEELNKYEENEICNDKEKYLETADTFYVMQDILSNELFYYFNMFVPILIIFISIKDVHKEIESQNYKYKLSRMSYRKYIINILKKSYKHIWIVPLIYLYIFIWSYHISGHFDPGVALQAGFYNYAYICKNNTTFIITYILSIILTIGYYINIGLTTVKYNSNVIIMTISATIIHYFIHIMNEFILIPYFWKNLINQKYLFYFDFLDPYSFYGIESNLLNLFRFLIPFTISLIILIISYKNKEKNIIQFEKLEK